jgi:hypothetical protein
MRPLKHFPPPRRFPFTMEHNPLRDPSSPPTPDTLESTLGASHLAYRHLVEDTAHCHREWMYSEQEGWMLKAECGGKPVYYLVPLYGEFRATITVAESERKTLLDEPAMKPYQHDLWSGTKYADGFALHYMVRDADSLAFAKALVDRVVQLRTPSP